MNTLRSSLVIGVLSFALAIGATPQIAAAATVPTLPPNMLPLRLLLIDEYLIKYVAHQHLSARPLSRGEVEAAVCASGSLTCPVSAHQTVVQVPNAPAGNSGNPLIDHLQSLFVLDKLFRSQSEGLLSPNGAGVGDLMVLYMLFYDQSN